MNHIKFGEYFCDDTRKTVGKCGRVAVKDGKCQTHLNLGEKSKEAKHDRKMVVPVRKEISLSQ